MLYSHVNLSVKGSHCSIGHVYVNVYTNLFDLLIFTGILMYVFVYLKFIFYLM